MSPEEKIFNLPNMLSLLRVILVPVFFMTLIFMRYKDKAGVYVPAIIYILTGITDALDGKIARKYGLVTDFGKFIDPLADKFMVLGSFIAILTKYCLTIRLVDNYKADITFTVLFAFLFLIVLFRELAVTSLRLVVAGKQVKVDLAANIMGKLKTVSQMVGTVVFILEPSFNGFSKNHLLSYIFMVIIAVTTVWSGINYLLGYLPYIAEKKQKVEALPEANEPEGTENSTEDASDNEAETPEEVAEAEESEAEESEAEESEAEESEAEKNEATEE
jgi:CDP-diacylglycerol--glycerol-3-phosphate 3-phosphatidyltransferase